MLPSGSTHIVAQTAAYDHCNFSVLDDLGAAPKMKRFTELLLGMSYADPTLRPLMDLEGLRAWLPGRTEGYALLEQAIDAFGTIDGFVTEIAGR